MTVLLDNTVLSNFSRVRCPDLVRLAFVEEVGTTTLAFEEMRAGIVSGRLAECDWTWLTRFHVNPAEQQHFDTLVVRLGRGEASCLAVAFCRGYRMATDDRDARRVARQLSIPLSGTIGILAALAKQERISHGEGNRLLRAMVAAGYRAPVQTLDEVIDSPN